MNEPSALPVRWQRLRRAGRLSLSNVPGADVPDKGASATQGGATKGKHVGSETSAEHSHRKLEPGRRKAPPFFLWLPKLHDLLGVEAHVALERLACFDASHARQSSKTMSGTSSKRDKPWLFRTYAGHSTATASNELYRRNLAKGQTGLSVAFDLPTQTGYDPDHPLARGEVGKVGVPISHLGDMRELFDGHSARRDEYLDDHQCHGSLAARALCRRWPTSRAPRDRTYRHGAERHPEGISFARNLYFPASALAAAYQGHDRLHRARDAEMEPDQCLLLPFAGGGSDAGAGTRLRARHGRGGAR